MKKILSLVVLLLASAAVFAQQPKAPVISIQNFAQPTPTSISYDVAVGPDCIQYIYVHADTNLTALYQQMGMSIEQFLEYLSTMGIQWVSATEGQVDHYEFSDFEPNTIYDAYIYAKSSSGQTAIASHRFTTSAGGGSGQAQLTMNLTFPANNQAHLDISINDQTAYYWYTTFTDTLLASFNLTLATATTDDYYQVLDQFVNTHGLTYLVHTAALSEDFILGQNIEAGIEYAAVAFPFNADGQLGLYSQPLIFSLSGANSIIRPEEISLSVWPNPASQVANIHASTPILEASVIDLRGRKVQHLLSDAPSISLPVSHLPAGFYLLKVRTAQGTAVQKLIIK